MKILDRDTTVETTIDAASRIEARLVDGVELLSEERGRPEAGLSSTHERLGRAVGGKRRTDGALPIFLFDRSDAANEFVLRCVEGEDGCISTDVGDRVIDNREILELCKRGGRDACNLPLLNLDLGPLGASRV